MEEQIRLRAFAWLEEQVAAHGDVLPWTVLQQGFEYQGQRVTVLGQQGIWKPKVFERVPLSIRTGTNSPYQDAFTSEDFLLYRYRGTDPFHKDNVGLREAMRLQIPLIYFHAIVRGKYLAVWPVYVIGDDPKNLAFTVAADDRHSIVHQLQRSAADADREMVSEQGTEGEARRQYITSTVRQRLHQRSFRERVLAAYQQQCAFCRLRYEELLDAAHIIADAEEQGEPHVNNGLSLCKIHHAAFDRNIVGVSPDYRITVKQDVLEEIDGPMLRHGIQELHQQQIVLPRNRTLWPDQQRLDTRYQRFAQQL